MRIRLNGEERETAQQTVSGLLDELEITVGGVAVELNTKVLKKDDFESTPIGEGDVVEIINFVGGG